MSVYISTIIDYWWSQVSSLCVSVYINEKILPREHRNVGQEDWGSSEENIVNDASRTPRQTIPDKVWSLSISRVEEEEAGEFSSNSSSHSHNLLLSDNFRRKVFM